ncbi:hypothetical protein [Amycolatopsis taiwanensis]|uniref:hypothetical protein n=1 Tax=Amycolatopsis taiwanensis TaxID=342230 RepID=UPI000483BA04|nr:hypothetical protein [Amycolatopsis taiwanensis]
MLDCRWVLNPVGRRGVPWLTRTGCKQVLVMMDQMVAGTRLLDLLPLLEVDHRVQVVFTVPEPPESWRASHEFVEAQGGVVIPWSQARHLRFDLAIAAGQFGIDEVDAPVMLVPHGYGFGQYRLRPRVAGDDRELVMNLDREQLMRDGRVRAEVVVLIHDAEREVLARTCPEALSHAVIGGNIAFDRLLASVRARERYRRALKVTGRRKLVVVSSTWTSQSAFGRHPDLFGRIMAQLPPEDYQVVGLLHPNIWAHHGRRQVRAWLEDCLCAGLGLVPPEEGWRAALIAADFVIGDYGSVTGYAAGLGTPLLLAAEPDDAPLEGSPSAALLDAAWRWKPERALLPQLEELAESHAPDTFVEVRRRLTSRPGQAAAILRRTMYGLLGLPEPARPACVSPVPLPTLVS